MYIAVNFNDEKLYEVDVSYMNTALSILRERGIEYDELWEGKKTPREYTAFERERVPSRRELHYDYIGGGKERGVRWRRKLNG